MLTYLAASLLLCAYTWVGYPLLIGLLAFVRPLKAPQTRGWQPSVSACVAVHNGEPYIKAKLESLLSQLYPADRIEVLVYADGCTDRTEALVAEMAGSDPRVRLLSGARRSGKPTALNHMRLEARGEVLVMTDVRQPLAPETFGALVAALGPESVGCVSGNLVLEGDTGASFYWRYENWIRHAEARFRSMVGVTGPIYAVRRRDVPELPEDTILDDMWIPMRLRLAGKLLLFAPEAQARDDAFGDEREFSRKARTLAGNYQLFWRLPRLMLPFANPSWFETVSHKLLRLVCAWILLSLPFATMGALFDAGDQPGVLRWTLMSFGAAQGLFLATAALGSRALRPGVLARSFVVLNAAAIAGLWRFLTGRQRITW